MKKSLEELLAGRIIKDNSSRAYAAHLMIDWGPSTSFQYLVSSIEAAKTAWDALEEEDLPRIAIRIETVMHTEVELILIRAALLYLQELCAQDANTL